jgi:signal transduction histidine kinase
MPKVFVALLYATVLILVIGGLAAVTMTALRVERAQQSTQVEAELATKTRLALWRLDTRLYTDLAREAGDLPGHYRVRLPADFPASQSAKKGEGSKGQELPDAVSSRERRVFFELVATSKASKLPYVRRHYVVFGPKSGPLDATWYEQFGIALEDRKSDRDQESVTLASRLAADGELRKRLAEPQQAAVATSENSAQAVTGQHDRDLGLRNSLQMAQNMAMPKLRTDPVSPNGPRFKTTVLSIVGGVVPVWTAGPEPMLVLARSLPDDNRPAYVLSVLDWRLLVSQLHDDINDLVPDAELRPITSGAPPSPDRALTALPFELTATARPARSLGWTPLRLGLVLVWTAAAVALAAATLGGLSLWELSQRRMRFVSTVTHELRTPLTTIRLYIDMLAQGMVGPEKRTEYLETLRTEADRLDRLVRNVLDFSRLENQTPRLDRQRIRLCDLLGAVDERWRNACLRSGKTLVVCHEIDSSFELTTDATLVEQILGNLIDNACKYSQGSINSQIELRGRELDNGRIVLEVQDYGPGIKEGERAAIFRPFRRGVPSAERPGGVGLGLALASRWSRLLGGRLELAPASTKGGACFRVVLNVSR